MSFVARFDVDDDVIMFARFDVDDNIIIMNEAEFNFDNDVILIDEAILMFWCNELTWFNSSAFVTFIINVLALLSLTVFFDLETDCELRCMILLLN